MKNSWSPWLLLILFFIIVYGAMFVDKVSLATDTLNEEVTTHQREITRLKEIIKQQDRTILEQQEIIEERDKEIKELRTLRNVRVTAYAPLDDRNGINSSGNPNVTATGESVGYGVVAVDPSEIPYGTELHVPGYGDATAKDTGGALRNYAEGIAIDVHMDTYEEAMAWGVRYLDVTIQ